MTVMETLRAYQLMEMICAPDQDYIWRVEIHDGGSTDVRYIGFCPVDNGDAKVYDDFADIPDWMQHRVAALCMMPPDPNTSSVYGVGRRINDNTYWVVQ